jgi:glyoxylase I family protein
MFKGIEHTAIATPDPEALAQWYEQKLDFPICHRYGGNVFVRAPDGTMLELIPSVGDPVKTEIKTPGIRHLAIRVEDFDAGVRAIEERGIEIFDRIEGGGNRLAFFYDLDGNILHLIHREVAL